MGIFDGIFNTGPQQDAATAQVRGIQQGLGGLQGAFQQGQADLTSNYSQGQNALQTYGTTGVDQLRNYYTQGLSPFLQNYAQANLGSKTLADALGLNGPAGNAAAIAAFQNNPAYKFGLDQGENAIAAQAQRGGMGASGNALTAAGQFATNYANQGWANYLANLQPFLGASENAASGIGGLYSGVGNQINANQLTTGAGTAGIQTGLGSALNQSQMELGRAIYGANTSAGNAYANADLAQAGANANIFNTLGQGITAYLGSGRTPRG